MSRSKNIAISGTGLYVPPFAIGNEELVGSYNRFAERFNAENADAVAAGTVAPMEKSDVAFIEKASGIKNRFMMEGEAVIDPALLRSKLSPLADEDIFGQPVSVKMSLAAAEQAMAQAGVSGDEIDLVIYASSVSERVVPSIACEIQKNIGSKGFAYDMAMACSSATFGISSAFDAITSGMAGRVLVITCEYISPLIDHRNRDNHFIFGDAAVAMIIEDESLSKTDTLFRIISRKLHTDFSKNIRAGYGTRMMAESDPDTMSNPVWRFSQEGRTVFRELVPAVINHVRTHLGDEGLQVDDIRRMWLHQANIHMNQMAARKLLGTEPTMDKSPVILDEFANTAGAGVMIAFHKYRDDFKPGEKGMACSFGAGYSIGSLLVEKQ